MMVAQPTALDAQLGVIVLKVVNPTSLGFLAASKKKKSAERNAHLCLGPVLILLLPILSMPIYKGRNTWSRV